LELSAERIRDRNFSTDSFITSVIGDGQCNIGCGAPSLRGPQHTALRVSCPLRCGARRKPGWTTPLGPFYFARPAWVEITNDEASDAQPKQPFETAAATLNCAR
jgi:hypothetical protein